MKRIAALFLISLAAFSTYARTSRAARFRNTEPVVLQATEIPDARAWATRVTRQAREHVRAAAKAPRTNAIINNSSARALIIPAAGSVRGAGGTFFRSDITFVNYNENNQRVGVLWLPNGGGTPRGFSINIAGNHPPTTTEDFVGTTLGLSGLGAIILLPVDATGDFDENGAIDAYSRIWTPQPNATGTVSQPFPAVEPDYLTGNYEGIILGMRQDANYRTNYGIVNVSEADLPFTLTVFPETGSPVETTINVPSLSMVQTGIPAGNFGKLTLALNVNAQIPDNDFTWVGYASSTDNITGDGWVSIAATAFDDDDLDSEDR
ncbi:MAG: hypothetical protein M3Q69_10740 [Acidobacteriota bacterium]|nr:hypothetical protein [Acidobacteriota bacterium]